MRRRTFLRGAAGAGGVGGLAALTGCSLLNNAPPPRRSNAISGVRTQDGSLRVEPADDPWIQSRKEASAPTVAGLLAGVSPVGGARAAKGGGGGGRGATGRGTGGYSSAPRTSKGRAWWHGGAYADDWEENHEDDIQRYDAEVAAIGVAFLGSDERFEDNRPGAGSPPAGWDATYDPGSAVSHPIEREGWYRVGARMEASDGTSFGWESVDMELDRTTSGYRVDEKWKVSPRL